MLRKIFLLVCSTILLHGLLLTEIACAFSFSELLHRQKSTSQETTTTTTAAPTPARPTIDIEVPELGKIIDKHFGIATAGHHTPFYAAGNIMCLYFNHTFSPAGLYCRNISSHDLVANVQMLNTGSASFAFSYSNLERDIINGTGLFSNKGPDDRIRYVMALNDLALTIVVRDGLNFSSLDSLRNRIINIPKTDEAAQQIVQTILTRKGWNNSTFKDVTNFDMETQRLALCNGTIDCAIFLSAHPNDELYKLSQTCQIDILDLSDDSDITNLVQSGIGYKMTTIPGGFYFGLPDDINTLGVKAIVLASSDTDNMIVYKMAQTALSNLDKFRIFHPSFATMNQDTMFNSQQLVPKHDGLIVFLADQQQKTQKSGSSTPAAPIVGGQMPSQKGAAS